MIRVAFFLVSGSNSWLGGANYIANLLHAVMAVPNRRIEPVLFASHETTDEVIAMFPAIEVVRTSLLSGRGPLRVLGKAFERGLGRNLVLEQLLRKHGISALSHAAPPGLRFPIPTIVWIPDFQHRRLPRFFRAEDLANRDRNYRFIAENAKSLVLSSHDAQNDLADFLPSAVAKSHVLQFTSGFLGRDEVEDIAVLERKYDFSGPYLYLPNQFWKHKNHDVVVEALALLKARDVAVTVLCTGHSQDFRNPDYFDGLKGKIERYGLERQMRILGLVPYQDLRGLMHAATALINPSLFEGWSTTVEEAKSAGKRMILSDIPVHREQAPRRGLYFDPHDPATLAEAMQSAMAAYSPEIEAAEAQMAQRELPQRFIAFGQTYQDIVLKTVQVGRAA